MKNKIIIFITLLIICFVIIICNMLIKSVKRRPASEAKDISGVWPENNNLVINRTGIAISSNVSIYYHVRSEKKDVPHLIVISGGGCSAMPFKESLAKLEDQLAIVHMDIRGSGNSQWPQEAAQYKFDLILNDIEAVRNALNQEKIYIMGHSHYGMIAAEYALEHPENVFGLIFDSGGPIDFKGQTIDNLNYAKGVLEKQNRVLNGLTIAAIDMTLEHIKENIFNSIDKLVVRKSRDYLGHILNKDKLIDAWRKAFKNLVSIGEYSQEACSQNDVLSQELYDNVIIRGQDILNYTVLNVADKLPKKTLILCGVHDTLIGIKWCEKLSKVIKNSNLTVLNNSGHLPLIDETNNTISAIRNFISY